MAAKHNYGGKRYGSGRKPIKFDRRQVAKYATRVPFSILSHLHCIKRQQVKGYRTSLHIETDAELLARLVQVGLSALQQGSAIYFDDMPREDGKVFTLRVTAQTARQIEAQMQPDESYYTLIRRLIMAGLMQLEKID